MLNRKTRNVKSSGASGGLKRNANAVLSAVEGLESRALFAATPAVTGFVLYNAATDQPIADVTSGVTINLAKLPQALTLVAKTSGAESIRFGYDDKAIFKQDSTELYALAGKNKNDLYQIDFKVGTHEVTAIAYSQDVMQGTASATTKFTLNVVRDNGDSRTLWSPTVTNPSNPTTPTSPPPPVTTVPPPPPPVTTVPPPPPPPTTTVPPPPPPPVASSGSAKLETNDTTVIAGQAFFASGNNTSLSAGQAITANYVWNFGDPSGKYNTLTGFNAAHRYQNPGNYTVTLTVTDEAGKVMTSTQSVTVVADNRKTIYVSNTGNDKNDGLSTGKAVATIEQAEKLATNDTRILFQRGGTWNVTDWLYIKGSNIEVGAYGTGNKPVLKRGANNLQTLLGIDRTSADVVVHDIAFDTNTPANLDKAGASTGISVQGSRTAIYDCDFLNVVDAINTNTSPAGLLVQDNVAPKDSSIRGYFVWLQGSDAVIIGNTALNSTREHIVRVGGADRVLMAQNTFGNKDLSATDRYDIAKSVFNNQVGSFIYITDNDIFNGVTGVGPLGGADGVAHPESRVSNVVIDGNTFNNANIAFTGGSSHIFMRNNLIYRDYAEAILINPTDTFVSGGKQVYAQRTIEDLTIANNTQYSTGTSGNFLLVKTMGKAGQITLANNVLVAPNLTTGAYGTAAVYIQADAATAKTQFKSISGNVWGTLKTLAYAEGGYFYVWPSWSDKKGYLTPAEWAAWGANDRVANLSINTTSGVVSGLTSGVTSAIKGVFDDLNGKARSFSNTLVTAGAIQA